MKNIKVLLLASLFCVACNHSTKKTESEDVKEIHIVKNLSDTQKVNLSTVASSIEYCALETDVECLVVPGMPIYCAKENIVTIGNQKSNTDVCYVFERKSGKFVRQISRQGQGPGEYLFAEASYWDGINEQVCFFGNNQYLFFNVDGTLSHQTKRFEHYMNRFVEHRGFFVGYTPNRFGDNTVRIAFYDKAGSFVDSIPNHRTWEKTQSWSASNTDDWLYVFQDNLYFKDLYTDTLYQVKDFKLYPRYVFNTGKRSVPYKIQEGGRFFSAEALKTGVFEDKYEKYVVIMKILEDDTHLYFTIEHKNLLYPAIYNKAKDQLQVMAHVSIPPLGKDRQISLYGFENDLDGGLPFWPRQMISEKEMMCVYSAEELLKLDASKITDEKLKNVLNNLEKDSNPVIAIVTLKD